MSLKITDKDVYFAYLDMIREDGEINMFESPNRLCQVYGISKKEAFKIFMEWTEDYKENI